MAGSDIYVSFGGDTAGLEASLASARASLRSFSAELARLSRQQVVTGATADSELGQKMLIAAGKIGAAKSAISTLGGELSAVRPAAGTAAAGVEAVGAAAMHAGGGFAFYSRELRALFDELSSGRDHQAVGTFSKLAGAFLSANAAMIPLFAGVLAGGGILAYFGYEAVQASRAVANIVSASVIGQITMTAQAAAGLRDRIKALADVSSASAVEIARPFLALGPGGVQIAEIVSTYLPQLAAGMGTTTTEAAKTLAEAFADLSTKGRALVVDTARVTGATIQTYDAHVAAGQSGKAYGMVIDALRVRFEAAREAELKAAAATADRNRVTSAALGGVLAMAAAERTGALAADAATAKYNAQMAALAALKEQLGASTDAANAFARAIDVALKLDKVGSEIRKTTGELALMKTELAKSVASGDTTGVSILQGGIDRATDSLKKLQQQADDGLLGRDAVAKAREQITAIDQSFTGSSVGRLQRERAVLSDMLAGDQLGAEQRHQVELDLAAKDKEIRDASHRAFENGEELQVLAAGQNAAKVIAIRKAELAEAIRVYGQGSDAAMAAARQVAEAQAQAAKSSAAGSRQAPEIDLSAQIDAEKSAAKQSEALLDEKLKTKQLTDQQWLASTLAVLSQEYSAVQATYAKELAVVGLTSDKSQTIKKDEANALAAINSQVTQAEIKAAEQTTQAWQKSMQSINGAFDSQIDGLLKGTTNWHTAVINVLRDLTENTIKYFVNAGLQDAESTARSILFGQTKLAAHVAGNAAMAASDASAGAAGDGAALAGILRSIEASAAATFAGVTGFMAPIIGPAAPAAGAAAEATVISVAGGLADSGAWSLPSDMLIGAHKGEMIIPQRGGVADEFRSFMSGGGFGGASAAGASAPGRSVSIGGPSFHIHSPDATGVAEMFDRNNGAMVKAIQRAVRNGAHLSMGRGARFA